MMLTTGILAGGLVALLIKLAIAAVVIWGIYALIQYMGWEIPRPVQIVLICLVSIAAIYILYAVFIEVTSGG
jgi:hypothetical protein